MVFKNVVGQSYQLYPANLANPNDGTALITTKQTSNNKVIFYGGTMPTPQEVLGLTLAGIDAKYTKLVETLPFDVTYSYAPATKKRTIRKTTIDAQDLKYLAAGTITFAVFVMNNPDVPGTEFFIVTDSIGLWGENTMPIIIDNKVGTVGSRNLFKNISIELTDKSNYN